MEAKSSAEQVLESMGLTLDEVREADETLRGRPKERDGRICICGHPVNRHTVTSGVVLCKPTRMECPCRKVRPVLDVSDTRAFLRKTAGPGPEHALSRGLRGLTDGRQGAGGAERSAEWVVDLECDRCGGNTRVVPAPVTSSGNVVHEPTGYDALLCAECLAEV